MSDYMFMLESHLSAGQNRVVTEVQSAADQANVNLFLTGGAMRDMLGGFLIRDLDFTVEGNALKLAKAVSKKTGARIVLLDDHRRSAHLLFPGGVTAEIAMARQERHTKLGARPQVSAATIYEDLRGRDFTVDAIALSLNRASLGLLVDPNNGFADLERRELRAVHNYIFYDDPGRLLRLVRFRMRFSLAVDEKTQHQYENARLEEMERRIPPRRLFEELNQIASDSNLGEVVRALAEEKLLDLFSPALTGAKLNLPALGKLQRAKQMIPFGVDIRLNNLGLLLYLLTEKLTPREKATLIKLTAMRKSEVRLWQGLPTRSRKWERELKSVKVKKASQIYQILSKAPGEEILFLFLRSSHRLVQDRIRNYLLKYLPAAQEITDGQVAATGAEPGAKKFEKLKQEMIAARLDGRAKKPPPPPIEEPVRPSVGRPRGRPPRREPHETHRPPKLSAGHEPRAAGARRQ
jgi:tRNA nucleotidyltransferase/poly(A) polymerase